ncbi:MAG: polysaccharide deacetylase family protein [Alphaproteobacteria bacterium]|nr:polysaccharide deacetylase family protein [Alphaproteobacteria bacterium]
MQLVSFCFDDGFAATQAHVRRAFAPRGLAATFCILAEPERAQDAAVRACPVAGWETWRAARAEGHEVECHGLSHERLADLPLPEAQAGLARSLAAFARELPGFSARDSMFHAAYLAVPRALMGWLADRVLAVRTACGRNGLNRVGDIAPGGPVDCVTFGPQAADGPAHVRLARFLAEEEGWLVLVFHGVGEGAWGPLSVAGLDALLDLARASGARIAPASRAFRLVQAEARSRAGRETSL